MRNTKTVLASILMIGIVAMAVGAGTLAYFTDVETSTGNTFMAGTLDLNEDVVFTMTAGPMAPGESSSAWYNVSNGGNLNLNISEMTLNVTGEADGSGSTDYPTNLTADQTAANITVDVTETSTSTTIISGAKLDALTSDQIDDTEEASVGTLAPSDTRTFKITLTLDGGVDNTMQNDGVEFTVTIGANQPSQ